MKQAIVAGVVRREPTIDFQSAYIAGLEGKSDQEVLTIAAQSGRILVTHDRKRCLLNLVNSAPLKPVHVF